jgi:hypothetical protein
MGVFGTTSRATVENGGTLFELAGVTSEVSLAGTQYVGGKLPGVPLPNPPPTAVASSTLISSGGVLIVNGNGSAVGADVLAGGEIVFNGGAVSGLEIASGGAIDLPSFAFAAAEKIACAENGAGTQAVLTITSGTRNLSITLFGQYIAAGFHPQKDAAGATEITYTPAAPHGELAAAHV